VTTSSELVPNEERMIAQREMETLQSELRSLERQLENDKKRLQRLEELNTNFFVVRNEYIRIVQDMEEAERQLQFWEQNLRQTVLALTAEVSQSGIRLSVVRRAPEAIKPFKPNFNTIAMMALAAGLGLGAALVLLAEFLDRTFVSVDHVSDELKLPVLGAVNQIVETKSRFRSQIMEIGVFPAIAIAMLLVLLLALAYTWISLDDPARVESWMNTLFGGG